jgi:AI-2 transport protein TqsA
MMGTAVGLIAAIAVVAALDYASTVFAPVAFAIFIIAIVWPLQRELQARLPRLIALAIVMAVTAATFVAFGSLIGWAFGRIGRALIAGAAQFQGLYEQLTAWLEGHGIVVASLWAEHFNVGWLIRTAQGVTSRVNTTMSFWLVVLVYVLIGLLEVDDARAKVAALQNRDAARVVLDGSAAMASRFRRYMLVRTLMSVMTGVLIWAFATLMGLPLALEWGAIAFVLNYIPFIGPFVATVLPTLYALAQFASWQAAVVLFSGLNLIQFAVGSYIEPRVAGNVLAMSPFVVLFAVFAWMFLWGIAGAFIGVPITIAAIAFCAQHPKSRWIADLLGSPKRPSAQSVDEAPAG